jgi:ribosomal protein L37AE/L43A
MPSTFKASKLHLDTDIHICPSCGSKNTNKVTLTNFYCADCCVEFDYETRKVYTIQWDGTLTDYYENEFINCG